MNTRQVWMDVTRGVAILLVVAYHSTSILARFVPTVPEFLIAAGEAFSPFRMPVLMLLSGMLLHRALQKPARRYFDGKVRSILWPYLLWSFVFLLVSAQLTLSSAIRVIVVPPTYLWYLWFLLAYFVGSWFIHRLKVSFLLVSGLSMVIAAFAPEDHRISRFFFLFAFFALGHWIATRPVVGRIPRKLKILTALVCAGVIVLAAFQSALDPSAIRYRPEAVWAPLAAVILVLLLQRRIPTGRLARPFIFVGQRSMIFYVTHFPAIWIADWWLHYLGVDNPWVFFCVGVGIAIAIGCAFAWADAKWQLARALFAWPRQPLWSRPKSVSEFQRPA